MKIIYSFFASLLFVACNSKKQYSNWEQYKGSDENIHYSSLTEVDTSNVSELKPAWIYHTGDVDTANHSQIQCNPIIIDGILYGTSPKMKLFAIDAVTGNEQWQFNPFDSVNSNRMFFILNNCRGITYWDGGKKDERIYYTAGSFLYAINTQTGKPVPSFADNGKLDLHDGLGVAAKQLFVTCTSPGIIYNDLIIIGSRVDEGPQAAPGHIRAYDVRTGKLAWIFHTIPQPGDPGFDSWKDPNAWKYTGGANAWGGLSLDKKRGIVFACTGSANYDWWGGRRKGNNLFADCLLAIDAATGKLLWHFQNIHHDVWDRDLPAAPALVTIKKDGKDIDAVALTTKTGFVFVFERATGKPVYDIQERPVPAISHLAGEDLSPTQPYPVKPAPFMRQLFKEEDVNPLLPDSSYQDVKNRRANYLNDHMYNPPSLQGTIEFPGLDGGAEWGGPTFDPATGVLYINANEMAWVIQGAPIPQTIVANENYEKAGQRLYQSTCMACHGADRKGSGNFPSIINVASKYTLGGFDTLIQTGRRMMPGFKQLSEAEREAIASFVMDIHDLKEKPFTDTVSKKDNPFKLPFTITGYNKFLTKDGLPAISPPWGTINAIDLNTGEYIWKKPLGNEAGVPQEYQPTGTENYGASVVTAGGLLFIAATKDKKIRAFNKRNGDLLWQFDLPAAGFATPSIYQINGKQYIVIACGGGKLNTASGDSYVAFAL